MAHRRPHDGGGQHRKRRGPDVVPPRQCHICLGTGKIVDHRDEKDRPVWTQCPNCKGKGYTYDR